MLINASRKGPAFGRFQFDEKWGWNEIFAALSRERAAASTLSLPIAALEERPEACGVRVLSQADERYRMAFDDGSFLHITVDGGIAHIQLEAAALPEITWLPQLEAINWVALPSGVALMLIGLLGSVIV